MIRHRRRREEGGKEKQELTSFRIRAGDAATLTSLADALSENGEPEYKQAMGALGEMLADAQALALWKRDDVRLELSPKEARVFKQCISRLTS